MVEDYVDIERARFGDKLPRTSRRAAELRDAQVPPLSVQSLVENAVKHGITPQRNGGEVCVSASAENGQLRIEVSDTGAGFDLSAIRAGHGLDCLVGRLDALFSSGAHLAVSRRDGPVRRGDGVAAIMKLRAYLVDDEPLAVARLTRLLGDTGRVDVIGSATDPEEAVEALTAHRCPTSASSTSRCRA